METIPDAAPIILGIMLGIVFLVTGLQSRDMAGRRERAGTSKSGLSRLRRVAWITIVGGVACLLLAALVGLTTMSAGQSIVIMGITVGITTFGLIAAVLVHPKPKDNVPGRHN